MGFVFGHPNPNEAYKEMGERMANVIYGKF